MSSKAVLLVMACFLLINTRVSSEWEEEILFESGAHAPVTSPLYMSSPPSPPICPPPPPVVKAPSPPPPVKASPPPPVKAPSPPPPVVKVPSSPPPPAKASPPPPIKAPAPPPPVKPPRARQDCIPLCVVRCKNHSRKNICLRACLTCCERCKCVPPGQYGNKEKCGKCYTEMTTRGGKLKCP